MNQILKMIVVCGVLMLTMFGCATSAAPEPDDTQDTSAELAVSPRSGATCDQFCQSQGGPNYLLLGASTQQQCTSRGGDWYGPDQGYTIPPGCCCSCRRPGFCL